MNHKVVAGGGLMGATPLPELSSPNNPPVARQELEPSDDDRSHKCLLPLSSGLDLPPGIDL